MPALAETALRLLAGRCRWGRLSTSPSRYGVTRSALQILPPGLDRAGRLRLRLGEAAGTAAPLVWLAVLVALAALAPLAVAAAGATVLVAAGWVAARVPGRRIRPRVIVLHGTAGLGPEGAGELELLIDCLERLTNADAALAGGRISAADHELVWSAVHERASAGRVEPQRRPLRGPAARR